MARLRRRRKHRKGVTLIPWAMLRHCKQAYKNIAMDAASGRREAYGPFLRMMADAHVVLQPAKGVRDERAPRPVKFVYTNEEPSATPEQPQERAGGTAEPEPSWRRTSRLATAPAE